MAADIRESLEGFLPRLVDARKQALSEAETVDRVLEFFGKVLGYDTAKELTRDRAVKQTFVDLAIKLEEQIPLLIEVVAAETALQIGHIVEARRAAARDNVPFILLTNGLTWNVYHVTLDEDLQIGLAFSVDLGAGVTDEAVEFLGLLHKDSVSSGGLGEFWQQRSQLGPAAIGRALFDGAVLKGVQQQLAEQEGIRVDRRVLAASIHDLLAPEAQLLIGPVRFPS